jgi:hypothetical protein
LVFRRSGRFSAGLSWRFVAERGGNRRAESRNSPEPAKEPAR